MATVRQWGERSLARPFPSVDCAGMTPNGGRRRHRTAAVAALLAAAITIAGCGNGQQREDSSAGRPTKSVGSDSASVASQAPSSSVAGSATPSVKHLNTSAAPAPIPAGYWELQTSLRSAPAYRGARGWSQYDQEGNERELEVNVSRLAALAEQRVLVYVNSEKVGGLLLSRDGTGFQGWDTERGHHVPSAGPQSSVEIRTGRGALIASGIYKPKLED